MKLTLSCPFARYRADMTIFCSACQDLCGHQYFRACKGWWALSPSADRCPIKGGNEHAEPAPAPGRAHHVSDP